MLISQAESKFQELVAARGKSLQDLLPEDLLSLGLEFYQGERATDAAPPTEKSFGDTLLFQWGSREAIKGYYEACFYFDLTRQFESKKKSVNAPMFQLSVQLQYLPTQEFLAGGEGNHWCRGIECLPEFKTFTSSHPATMVTSGKRPMAVQLRFNRL